MGVHKERDWQKILGSIGTVIITLAGLKDLGFLPPFQFPSGSQEELTVSILAVVAVTAFPIWVGFQIGVWRTKGKRMTPSVVTDRSQEQAEKDAISKLSKIVIVPPIFGGMTPYPHLTVHLSHKNDTPLKATRPYYLANLNNKQAFWVNDFMLKLASGNWIQWVTHNGEQAVQNNFAANKIELNPRYPIDYMKELGISPIDLCEKLIPSSSITKRNEAGSLDKDDFRNGIATELRSILHLFSDPYGHWNIAYPIWSSKSDQSRAALLGVEDHFVLRVLYEAIEDRNRYFAGRQGMDVAELDPLNLACVKGFSRAYQEISWLKTESYVDSLLEKARKSVGLI